MTDTSAGGFFLHHAWYALATRLAVVTGTLVALISLMQPTPVWVASLRGALAFFIARTVARWGLTALSVALKADRERQRAEERSES